MTKITIRHLRYFDALARHRHFGRAAEASSISQPALSLQVKELEEILGAPLVERGARQISLTVLGEEVAVRARDVLRAVDELGALARASTGPLSGRLRLGVIPTVAPYLLPKLLPVLQAVIPDLDLKIRETQTTALMAELAAGDLDAVIAALPLKGDGVEAVSLFEDPFLLASPAAAPLAATDPRALPADRLLLLEEGHCLREQALGACAISDLSTFGATSLTTLLHLVAHGQGVTLLPRMAAAEIADPRIALARLPAPEPSRTVAMAWRTGSPRKKQLQEIAARVRDEVAPIWS